MNRNATLTRPAVVPCPSCADPVIQLRGAMLDAEIVPGGTYRIEGAHAVRRSIRHMAHEFASGQLLHGGGHDRHHCPEVRPDWLNR